MNFEKTIELLNRFINDRIDMYGVRNTIAYLLDLGVTRADLVNLLFDEEDIDYVIECITNNPEHTF